VRHYAEDFPSALAPGVRLRPAPAAAAQGPEGRGRKVVLITGGGTGIGRAVALRLARGGWQGDAAVVLVLTGRRAAPLEECAQAARGAGAAEVLAWPADLTRTSPLYLPCISPISPLYLPHISPIWRCSRGPRT